MGETKKMRSRYDLMNDFEVENNDGNIYKDIFSYPNDENLTTNYTPKQLVVTNREKQRIDLTMFETYNMSEMDDIVQWYNQYNNTYLMNIGDILRIPDGRDILSFYNENVKD